MICRYEFGMQVEVIDMDAFLSGRGVVRVQRISDGNYMTVNVADLTPIVPLGEADTPRQLFPHRISTRRRKGVLNQMNETTLVFKFPPEAANKIANFTATSGEAEWNNILRGFESVLGCLPTAIEVKGTAGNVQLPTRVHAGIK